MMQPYCRAKTKRGQVIEECGRVLSTQGVCDRAARHVQGVAVVAAASAEPRRIPAPGAS
jgi:hypothetical protein